MFALGPVYVGLSRAVEQFGWPVTGIGSVIFIGLTVLAVICFKQRSQRLDAARPPMTLDELYSQRSKSEVMRDLLTRAYTSVKRRL